MKNFLVKFSRWCESVAAVDIWFGFMCLAAMVLLVDTCEKAGGFDGHTSVCRDSVVIVSTSGGRVTCEPDQKMTVHDHDDNENIFVTCECVRPEDAGADR